MLLVYAVQARHQRRAAFAHFRTPAAAARRGFCRCVCVLKYSVVLKHQTLGTGTKISNACVYNAGIASSGSVGSSEHACSPLPSLRGLQSSEEEELSGAYSCSNLENLERLSLEALSRETLRSVCFDLEVPFSGPKHVLIPRIMLKCNARYTQLLALLVHKSKY